MAKRTSKNNPHKSFKRSYREDYQRGVDAPGMLQHVFMTFGTIFKNWKLFLPLLVIVVFLNMLFVGLMSEANYVKLQDVLNQADTQTTGGNVGGVVKAGFLLISAITSGGVFGKSNEVAMIFGILIFLLIWLTTIFILRRLMAGKKVKLRDALYNSMSPLVPTVMIFAVVVLQCIPIFLLIIAYSAAVQTNFLTMPFYALMFLVFAILMIVLSGYLLSSSLVALIAVTVPGIYPMEAFRAAKELIMSRRIKFIMRIINLIAVVVVGWAIIMLPLILFDLWMKTFAWTRGIPFIPICLAIMSGFTCIYATTYLYLYYRWMLDDDKK